MGVARDFRFRPLTGISLFLSYTSYYNTIWNFVFVPSRGFLFFYGKRLLCTLWVHGFSSPHGDFSFSIETCYTSKFEKPFSSPHGDFSFSIETAVLESIGKKIGFRPLTGISLFLSQRFAPLCWWWQAVFVPSRGFLFFYEELGEMYKLEQVKFSSPHGDFSFSMNIENQQRSNQKNCFRPLTGISLFL